MNKVKIKYYHHSGFSCSVNDEILLVFDYWLGQYQELDSNIRITEEYLSQYQQVYVFVSHSHPDHYDEIIYTWRHPKIHYIISSDIQNPLIGRKINPDQFIRLDDEITVNTYESTDLGVAYSVTIKGIHIFHAGDLNMWHWREESSPTEIQEAENEFKRICNKIKEPIDIAFFPVDPRQGQLFEAGANYFQMNIKPKVMIPMHFWNKKEMIIDYAKKNRNRITEIIPMVNSGETIMICIYQDGYMLIEKDNQDEKQNIRNKMNDPFNNTDQPVNLDRL
ncbi:MAG: MBL fold metallo-hydrolase [Clostridia bacterium]|nr:MBL fold metallo-hydrolase [Clostridia bacterium]